MYYCLLSLEIITWAFWLSPAVSTRDTIIKPESLSSRTDNGRGLIPRAMTKTPCYNLFITYSKALFRVIFDLKIQNIDDFYAEIELRHKNSRNTIYSDVTISMAQ